MSIQLPNLPASARALVLASAALAPITALTACVSATEQSQPESDGTIRLQLQATTGDTVYRLWRADFTVTSVDDPSRASELLRGGVDDPSLLTFTSDDPEAFTLAVAHPEAVASR